MFNNIIYFIFVLIIFNTSYPGNVPEDSFIYSLLMLFLCWLVFAGYCRWGFGRLMARYEGDRFGNGRLSSEYQSLVLRLSIFAIFLFALDVYLFHLKYWLQVIPVIKHFSVLQGALVLSLFLFYLSTIWHFAHPAYKVAFQAQIAKRPFIISNLRFNIPILFPWLILSIVYDLISMSPWSGPGSFLGSPEGQMVFFAIFLCGLMVFIPPLIQYWWGCRPFEPSDKLRELKTFLHTKRFRYRDLLRWPIFEGRMMTAGIMGIIPRYRYILITDSLMEILSIDELKAVMAHEVGHAKYRHLFFYLLFFLGYMVLSYGLFDLFFYFFAAQPFFMNELGKGESHVLSIFYLALSLPILFTMLVYFRYVMGFFMRQFERQADTYSAVTMGSPRPTISSLEKIALLSGKSRELPSWHHFSIKERVDYLWRTLEEPGLIKRHNRLVAFSFAAYVIGAISLVYILNFSPVKQNLTYNLVGRTINQQLLKEPDNILLYRNLAMVYHKLGRYHEAIETYERIIVLDRRQAAALNNLAWLLVTEAEDELRDPQRALTLAKNAVALERSPTFLDTLAEAYYANGFTQEAIETIKEAIDLATENRGYYKKQLKKFMTFEEDRR